MCNESMFRNRLFEQIHVIFPKELNITLIMKDINKQIIHDHYDPLPDYVNKEMFIISFKKKIYNYILYDISNLLSLGYDLDKSVTISGNITVYI
jgi:hypothetical protein